MKPTDLGLFFVAISSIAVALLVATLIACTPGSGGKSVSVTSDVVAKALTCVVESEAVGMAPEDIALKCAIDGGATAVIDILATMDRRAAARYGIRLNAGSRP
jgi:hypothetical protein